MFINSVTPKISNNLSFQRKLRPEEEQDYRSNVLQTAFDYLGTKEIAMIIHGTSFPQEGEDFGVGSPYGSAAAELIKFEKLHGFNSNQLGPIGVIRDAQHISPYKSTISARNYLFIDFKQLTKDRYANILSDNDIDLAFNNVQDYDENYAYSEFPDAFANYEYCIKTANKNFKEKLAQNNPVALRLNNEYEAFKRQKGNLVYKEALYDVLAKMYGTPDFNLWSDLDKNLVNRIQAHDPAAISRYKKIVSRSKDDYDSFVFGQFILNKQIKENTRLRSGENFKYISDLLVGFGQSDEWAHQNLFLKDYRMGCPHGGKNGPQLWDIPVLDPNKFFNADGTLGEAGLYLKKKLESAIEDFDNIRIGLIDPYIYDRHTVEVTDGNINLSKFRGNNVSNMPEVDPNGSYKQILNKIIIPTLEEHGISKNSPVWEDLCTDTPVFNKVYHEDNHLPGITQLEWLRAENSQDPDDWGLVGSHDSDPAHRMIKKDWIRSHYAWNIFYLAGFLNSNPQRSEYRDSYCKVIDNDDKARVKAKFAELFLTCKKIQISFADFLGIDKTYNKGGEENDTNWKLRIGKDYEDKYYQNLSSDNPTAINMPEILKLAVQAKADMNAVHKAQTLGMDISEISAENSEQVNNLLAKLDKYEKILKMPEE